jgi:hypothetical protein
MSRLRNRSPTMNDNSALHSKEIMMDLDGSLSPEVAIIANRQDYDDIVTLGLGLNAFARIKQIFADYPISQPDKQQAAGTAAARRRPQAAATNN